MPVRADVALPNGIAKFGYSSNGDLTGYSGAGAGAFVSIYSPGSNWLFANGMVGVNSISTTYTNGSPVVTKTVMPAIVCNEIMRVQ
jgi:hypothetical protein